MQAILNIIEVPLVSHSMRSYELQTDLRMHSLSENDITLRETSSHFKVSHVQKAFEYFSLEKSMRSSDLAEEGYKPINRVVNDMYNELISDSTWTDRSKLLFEAINCGDIVDRTKYEGKTRTSDLGKKGKTVSIHAEDLVVLHVQAKAKLYWDREKELHMYAKENDVSFTTADPGPFTEYERRFKEAASDSALGTTEVMVRELVNGEAVQKPIRVFQKFIVERGVHQSLIQAVYEICSWAFVIQDRPLREWKESRDKNAYVTEYALKMNKKVDLIRNFSNIDLLNYRESTATKMSDKNIAEVPKKKQPSKFDRYYAENKKDRPSFTRVQLKSEWDNLSEEEKMKYANPDTIKKLKNNQKTRQPPAVTKAVPPPLVHEDATDPIDEECFSDITDADPDWDERDPDDGEGCVYPTDDEEEVAVPVSVSKQTKVKKPVLVKAPVATKTSMGNANAGAKRKISPSTNTAKPSKTQKVICKEIVHDLASDEGAHFLWELFGNNLKGMVEANKKLTSFEDTPFFEAYEEFRKHEGLDETQRFRMAKKVLQKVPGIVLCFQMFNIMYKQEKDREKEEDPLLFG